MAASSSSLSGVCDVFLSFRGEDVRKSLRSHLVKELGLKLITVYAEFEIEKNDYVFRIMPMTLEAIKNSRIAVVIFSRNYASSSWCLNELLEIVNCKDKIIIPIFYDLEPFHVRKQTGDFGEMFEKTCREKPEEVINLWKKALTDVATEFGFDSAEWEDEAKMVEEIANYVLGTLISTLPNDSVDFVGIQDHIANMSLLLQLQSEEVRMIGIYDSSGIGKTNIARTLFNQLSRHFQVSKFIDRSFVSWRKMFLSDHNMKLYLQGKFLSEIMGIDIKVDHLGALGERLQHRKVLIIIDDLDDQMVLDSLVAQPQWFGSGSRVIVVTNVKHLLTAHGIGHIYEVDFPTEESSREMLCQSAFRSIFKKFFSSMWGPSMVMRRPSMAKELPPQHQMYISFCGAEVRRGFLSHLLRALVRNNINVLNDRDVLGIGEDVKIQSKRMIEASRFALVIFSRTYTDSTSLLTELAMITDCVEIGQLVAIPIFYNLDPPTVRRLGKQFGDAFMHMRESNATKDMWKKALISITNRHRIVLDYRSNESDMIDKIVKVVKRVLENIPSAESQEASSVDSSENIDTGKYGIKQCLKVLGEKMDLNKIRSQIGMIIGCLLLLYLCLQHIIYTSTPVLGDGGGTIDRVVDIPKVIEYIPAERTTIKIDKDCDFPTGKYEAKPEDLNSVMDSKIIPPQIQVFINFRGVQLRNNFVGYLVHTFRKREVNVFIDNHEQRGEDLNVLFKRIEDSGIAIVVFSSRYTESKWCLEELVKIKERVQQGLLKVLPIFYKVSPTDVKRLKGEFGDHFRDKEYMYESDESKIKRWKEAILFVSHKFALTFDEKSRELEIDFVEIIVKEVLKMLQAISTAESGQSYG